MIAPTGTRVDKDYRSPVNLRREMIELWFDSFGPSRKLTLDFDILDEKVWEGTYDHDGYFREKYEADEVVHIFGTDTIASMRSWEPRGEAVAEELEKVFFHRTGYTPDWTLVDHYETMGDVTISDVSSTQVRDGDTSLLSGEIRTFVEKNGLYQVPK